MASFSFFTDLLSQSGWNLLTEGGSASVIVTGATVRQAVQKLEQNIKLQKHRIGDIHSSVRVLVENHFEMCLRCVEEEDLREIHGGAGGGGGGTSISQPFTRYGQQETFLKLLLAIEAVQQPLFECILQRLVFFDQEVCIRV
jgi:hypothetical protein